MIKFIFLSLAILVSICSSQEVNPFVVSQKGNPPKGVTEEVNPPKKVTEEVNPFEVFQEGNTLNEVNPLKGLNPMMIAQFRDFVLTKKAWLDNFFLYKE